VTTVPSTVEQPPVAEDQPARSTDHARWLVIGCYLLGAAIVTGHRGKPVTTGKVLAWQR
jgi:hypothetical protein